MSGITTHVLDTSKGRPAASVGVRLEILLGDDWVFIAKGSTDPDGRLRDLLPPDRTFEAGTYRLVFDTAAYFDSNGVAGFHPEVAVAFRVTAPEEHHHVPLLLSPFGYTTYRGS
jgi:5-hydroxyisourate hydrolase